MWDSKSGMTFLQRLGVFDTPTNPSARLAPMALRVHTFPLEPPLPDPQFLADREGDPPPDRVEIIVWPHSE